MSSNLNFFLHYNPKKSFSPSLFSGEFSTLHSKKLILVSDDDSIKNINLPTLRSGENVNLPSQATANWSSSTLRSEESLNSEKLILDSVYKSTKNIIVRIFDTNLNQYECKKIYEYCDLFFTDKITLTTEENYTHAITINLSTPELKIPKENVLGLGLEPTPFLNITPEFINYATQHIGTYYIGQLTPKLSIYPLFKQHYMYLPFILPQNAISDCSYSTTSFSQNSFSPEQSVVENVNFSTLHSEKLSSSKIRSEKSLNKSINKQKIMSLIISNKLCTNGQRYRHVLVSEILKTNLPIDIYGYGCFMHEQQSLSIINCNVKIKNNWETINNINIPLIFLPNTQITPFSEEGLNLPLHNIDVSFNKNHVHKKDERLKGDFNCEEPYNDYKFHICIENFLLDDYFSEKIINPLVSNTIPIYLGCNKITEYFPKGAELPLQVTENGSFSTIRSDESVNFSNIKSTQETEKKDMLIKLTGDVKKDMILLTHICNNVEYYEQKIHKNIEYVKDKVSLYKELERLFLS